MESDSPVGPWQIGNRACISAMDSSGGSVAFWALGSARETDELESKFVSIGVDLKCLNTDRVGALEQLTEQFHGIEGSIAGNQGTLRIYKPFTKSGQEPAKSNTYSEACRTLDQLGGAGYSSKNRATLASKNTWEAIDVRAPNIHAKDSRCITAA